MNLWYNKLLLNSSSIAPLFLQQNDTDSNEVKKILNDVIDDAPCQPVSTQ